MKNREKYADIILEFAMSNHQMAVYDDSKKPVDCNDVNCSNCLFMYCGGCGGCYLAAREWAESEYIEQVKISKKDRAFLDYLGGGLKYIARSQSGNLIACQKIIEKSKDGWVFDSGIKSLTRFNIDFPMVKWSDDEPWKIEDLKELEVVDEY